MEIGILIGSLRKDSYNRKIGNFIGKRYGDRAKFEIVEIGELPLFNEDLEEELPQAVIDARKKLEDKDGIVFISPEYNHSVSGVLKNALDWFSRDDYVLMRKPYISMGASNGTIGTTRAQAELRKILNSGAFQMYSIAGNEFLFARIQDKMDQSGLIDDQGTLDRLDRKMDEFFDFVDLIKNR